MGKYYIDYNILCPFYKDEGKNLINCEGVIEEATTRNEFLSRQKMLQFKFKNCQSEWWEKCPIAKGLTTKYE